MKEAVKASSGFDDLAEARSLIEGGEYERGLSHLVEAGRIAVAQGKAAELREIVDLGGIVSRHTEGRSRKRSEDLLMRAEQRLGTPSAAGDDVSEVLPRDEEKDAPSAPALTRVEPYHDLWRPLAMQCAFLPVYGFYGLVGAASSVGVPAWQGFAFMGVVWLLVTAMLVYWSKQGRQGLTSRAIAWGLLAWLSIFLLLLLPWRRTRRLLVPPRPNA